MACVTEKSSGKVAERPKPFNRLLLAIPACCDM